MAQQNKIYTSSHQNIGYSNTLTFNTNPYQHNSQRSDFFDSQDGDSHDSQNSSNENINNLKDDVDRKLRHSSGQGSNNGGMPLKNLQNLGISEAVIALSQKMNYPIDQKNGQRTFGPHPLDGHLKISRGCEIFVGKIPRAIYEDELVPLFQQIGKIYKMRLMMDFDGRNRGYCFITYTMKHMAKEAIAKFNNYEIRKGRFLGVCGSVDNCRLFIGGIPKCRSRNEIKQEIMRNTDGVKDVLVYPAIDTSLDVKNRGFAFIEYKDHRSAAMARRKLAPGRILIFNTQVAVDWAEPEDEMDEEIMSKVKILYVRNLAPITDEEILRNLFSKFGLLERVKKIRDYAFIHFVEREDALTAITNLNGVNLNSQQIEVTLAKPAIEKNDSSKMTVVGAKALAAAQAGVDPEALQAAQTASFLLSGCMTESVPDVIQSDLITSNDWKYLAKMYPTRSGKGRAAMRSCYLGYR